MTPIKFVKVKENNIDFDVMTLVNIVSHNNELVYFFVCQFNQCFRGKKTIEQELIEFSEQEFQNEIFFNYKIVS